jgi:tRNA threonylcarbamoyladenosine biosynthesis protein TsaE
MITKSLSETKEVAKNFLNKVLLQVESIPTEKAFVVGLYGELGSGKTAFVSGIAQELGIQEAITSPTFIIEKIYSLDNKQFKKLIHIDAYRLESAEELRHIGWKELVSDPHNIVFVEWPEKVEGGMECDAVIRFRFVDENAREITFED